LQTMDASLTEEQQVLRDAVARMAAELGPESPAALPAQGAGDEGWATLAEMGLLGMRLPASAGGMESSGMEDVLTAEELGRRAVPLPFVASAVCASSLLAGAGASTEVLASLCDGSRRLSPVLDPTLTRFAFLGEPGVAWETRGTSTGLVIERETRRLVAVHLGDECLKAVDLTRELRPVDAAAKRADIGDLGKPIGDDALTRALALTLTALSGDLVGEMQATLDAAVAHVRERVQFGVPVGTFQAVQHMAAEAHVSTEAARGLTWYAAWAVDELDPREALLAARTAKAYCSERGREVTETSMQMHGGVAFTWEYMIHVYVRRALLSRQTLGDEHAQLDAISEHRLGGTPVG